MDKIALLSVRNDYIMSRSENRDSIDTEIYNLISEINLIPFLIPNEIKFISNLDTLIDHKIIRCAILSGGNDLSILEEFLPPNFLCLLFIKAVISCKILLLKLPPGEKNTAPLFIIICSIQKK